MALLKANYNVGRDYLTNFEPFVADVLKEWPRDEVVAPERLRDELGVRFSIPSMPINTADVLRVRAADHRWIRRNSSSQFFPNYGALAEVPSIKPASQSVLNHLEILIERVLAYARESHGLHSWNRGDAALALERFAEEFSFELAMARRNAMTDPVGDARVPDNQALTVVSGFVRRESAEENLQTLHFLEEMVQGSMLANVLYFHDLGSWSENLSGLTIYLDTTVALRALGLTHISLEQATGEMMDLLRKQDVNVRIFEHTVDEMHGVLVSVAASLRGSNSRETTGRMNREVNDAAIQRNIQAADIETIAADLSRRLIRAGIQPAPTPETPWQIDVDASELRAILRDKIPYQWDVPLEKDVESAVAIHTLRKGRECRRLGRTPALFVTANFELARATQAFFSEDTVEGAIPHVMTDISLTTQLWVRRPAEHRDVPRRLLIAESHAALSEGPELWGRYMHAIQTQRAEGRIDDQEVKALVYAMESRESFLKLTHGNPDSVDVGTPLEVLDLIRSEAEDRASEKFKEISRQLTAAEEERDGYRKRVRKNESRLKRRKAEMTDLKDAVDELEGWKRAQLQRERNARRWRGRIVALAALAAAVILPVVGAVEGSAWIAAFCSAMVFVAILSAAWAYGKGGKWIIAAIGVVGVLLAVPVSIKALVGGGGGGESSKDKHVHVSQGETPGDAPGHSQPTPGGRGGAGQP